MSDLRMVKIESDGVYDGGDSQLPVALNRNKIVAPPPSLNFQLPLEAKSPRTFEIASLPHEAYSPLNF